MVRKVGVAATALVLVTGCKDPTEITFTLSTDVPCDRINGITIAVGSAEDVEAKPAATTSHTCTSSGDLGSIVTIPSGDKNAGMSIKVIAGVGRDPLECQPPNYGTGCILARRSLRFIPHTILAIDVPLRNACNGVVCATSETCINGACTSAEIADANACGGACKEETLLSPLAKTQVPSPLVCGDMSGLQPGAIWPMLGYCPTRIGRSPRAGAQTNGVRWTASVGAPIQSGITISANGTIYFGARDNKLYAASPSGQVNWSSTTAGSFSETVPAIGRDGTLYTGNDDTNLYAFDPGGGVKWTFPLGGLPRTAPNIGGDGTLFVGGGLGQNSVYALDPKGGQKWKVTTDGEIWASPTVGLDGTIYFGSEDSKLYAVRPDGSVKWTFMAEIGLQTAIVGPNGWIYFAGKPSLCVVDPDGRLMWVTKTDANATIPALGADGTTYAGTEAGSFYAFDERGNVKWQLPLTPFDTYSQPVIGADGVIYMGAMDGSFYAIAPFGAVKWKLSTGGPIHGSPAIGADGTIYFGSDDGKLYAVGP